MRGSQFIVDDKKRMATAVYWSYILNCAYLFSAGWPLNLPCSHTASFASTSSSQNLCAALSRLSGLRDQMRVYASGATDVLCFLHKPGRLGARLKDLQGSRLIHRRNSPFGKALHSEAHDARRASAGS